MNSTAANAAPVVSAAQANTDGEPHARIPPAPVAETENPRRPGTAGLPGRLRHPGTWSGHHYAVQTGDHDDPGPASGGRQSPAGTIARTDRAAGPALPRR